MCRHARSETVAAPCPKHEADSALPRRRSHAAPEQMAALLPRSLLDKVAVPTPCSESDLQPTVPYGSPRPASNSASVAWALLARPVAGKRGERPPERRPVVVPGRAPPLRASGRPSGRPGPPLTSPCRWP